MEPRQRSKEIDGKREKERVREREREVEGRERERERERKTSGRIVEKTKWHYTMSLCVRHESQTARHTDKQIDRQTEGTI